MNKKSDKATPPMDSSASNSRGRGRGSLDRDVQSRIGRQLRAMYEEVVQEGVPDRFAEILQRLEQDDKGKSS